MTENAATVFVYTPNPPWTQLGVVSSAADIHRSWLLMEKSPASFTAANDGPLITTVPGALDVGSTIVITSNVAGVPPWLGWVTAIAEELGSGRSTYTCQDFIGTFIDATMTPLVYNPPARAVAAIAFWMLTQAQQDRGFPMSIDMTQDNGPPLVQDLPVDSLLNTFKRMWEMTGYEWRFDTSIDPQGQMVVTPIWSAVVGRDVSAGIILREGTHFTSAKYTQDVRPLYETAAVVGGTGTGGRPISVRKSLAHTPGVHASNIVTTTASSTWTARRGAQFANIALQRQAAIYEPGVTSVADLAARALTAMELPLNAIESLELTCSLDALMGEDTSGATTFTFPFWVGDTVSVVSDSLRQARGLYRHVRCHGLTIIEQEGIVEGVYSVETAAP